MTRVTRYFVQHPLVTHLFMVTCLLSGLIALRSAQYETTPRVRLGAVNVTTVLPGAGPRDVELSVTAPLEEELVEVEGVHKLRSFSMEGLSVINVRFDPDVDDPAPLIAEVQKAVDRGSARLPERVLEKPVVTEISTDSLPVMEVQVTGTAPEVTLRQVARRLADALRGVEGVGSVDKVGYRDREVRIRLDTLKAHALGISEGEIRAAIARRNVRDAGGSIDSLVQERSVLTVGQFAEPLDVGEVILRSEEPGNTLQLRDVADIVLDFEDWQVQSRSDGQLAISLLPKKKPAADGIDTSARVRDLLARERPRLPAGVELRGVNDTARFTEEMVGTLLSNALLGLLLLLLTLKLFFSWRLAFWVAAGLPVAVGLTFVGMQVAGLSINMLTLSALILVLGILVDDAVVTAESIESMREDGSAPEEAAVRGAHAVFRPVLVSAITTVLAFLPVAFLGGLEGKFMWGIPVVVGIALTASLLESKLLLPAHLAQGCGAAPSPARFQRWRARYRTLVGALLRRRYRTAGAGVLIFLGIAGLGFGVLGFNLYPEMEIDTLNVKVELPPGTPFDATVQRSAELEQRIRGIVPEGDIQNITTRIGHHDTDLYGATEGRSDAWALVTILLEPHSQRSRSSSDIVRALRADFRNLEGYQTLIVEPLKDTPAAGKPVEIDVVGGDGRERVAEQLQEYLAAQRGVTDAWTSDKPGKEVVELVLHHRRLAAWGLTVADVVRAVRLAFDGSVVGELRAREDAIRYRLVLDREHRGRLDTLDSLLVPVGGGTLATTSNATVPLRSVADLVSEPGQASVQRYFGQPTTTVYADIDRSQISVEEINERARRHVTAAGLLDGRTDLRLEHGGELEQQREALGDVEVAFLFALLGMFVVLVLLFGSLTQPALVLAVIPFGLTGVVVGFSLQGMELSMIALVGVLGLTGVLVNDSLVMIARLNDSKGDRATLTLDEIAEGATVRFRPIVITSVTTMAGLFPTAYGIAGANPLIAPMVMAMAWGVLFGTLVTLLLLPCFYAIEQDARVAGAALTRRFMQAWRQLKPRSLPP